jgi:hypothetical protein
VANTVIVSTSDSNMVDEPLWMQATGGDAAVQYNAADDRALIDALVPNEGVLTVTAGTGFLVAQRGAGANFSVDIGSGKAVVQGDDGTNQRKYVVVSNGTVNCATPSAPGSGTRIHRIIIRIRDKQVIGSGTYDWTLELLEDTGSGTPAEPNSAITLALVSIASGQASVQTANITDSRPTAAVYGNKVLARHQRLTNSSTTTTETGVVRLAAFVPNGHCIRVSTGSLLLTSTSAGDTIAAILRYTIDGTTPTTSSTTLNSGRDTQNSLTADGTTAVGYYYPTSNLTLTVMLTVARVGGGGTVQMTATPSIDLLIEDLGPVAANSGTNL